MECTFCELPNHKELEKKILDGDILKRKVSEETGIPLEIIIEHMNKHLEVAEPIEKKGLKPTEKRNILLTNLITLANRLNTFYSGYDNMDATSTKQIVEMSDGIRKTAQTLAQLEGEIESEYNVTINQFNSLKFIIFEKLCENCKQKIFEEIGEMKEIVVP